MVDDDVTLTVQVLLVIMVLAVARISCRCLCCSESEHTCCLPVGRCWTAASRGRGREMKLARRRRETEGESAKYPVEELLRPQPEKHLRVNPGTPGATVRTSSLSAWATRGRWSLPTARQERTAASWRQTAGCTPTTTWPCCTLQSCSMSPLPR